MTPEDQKRYAPERVWVSNGMEALIRFLCPLDDAEMREFYNAVPSEDKRFYPATLEELDKKLAECEKPNAVHLVITTAQGLIFGHAYYRWDGDDSEKSTFGICIRPGYQGIGAGKALMNRLLDISREIGPPVMCLTVQKANERAFEMYKKMGFRVIREQTVGERFGFPAEPEYYMERVLR